MAKQILVIEDDLSLGRGIKIALQSDMLKLEVATSIQEAKEMVQKKRYDLFVLDWNLPDGIGLEYIDYFKKSCNAKVIMLTANDLETDEVAGLEKGADDFITKPFSLMVLRARVMNQLRGGSEANAYEFGAFRFDFSELSFYKNNAPIELSKTEQKLLKLLVDNRGRKLERSVLIDRVWTDGAEYVDENALSVSIKRLRDKLEDNPSKPDYIKTVYGVGYIWDEG